MTRRIKFDIEAEDKASARIRDVENSMGGLNVKSINLASALTTLGQGLNLAEQAFQAVKNVSDQTIGVAVDYARAVSEMGTEIGITADEASYLYQIADDLKIPVASLEMAFKQAVKNGIQPTVDNLKGLAGTYQAIEDPVKRAQYAMKIFGLRSGPEMQKLLEASPEAIDAMARSAEKAGLIMSEQGVKGAREYEIALDDLNDAAEGVKVSVGLKALPTVTDFLKLLASPDADKAADFINELFKGSFLESDLSKEARNAEQANGALTDRLNEQYEAWLKLHPELQTGTDEMGELSDKTWSVADAMSEYSTRLLFNQAAAGLDREASLELMGALGLVNDATLTAMQKAEDLKQKREDGIITEGEYRQAVVDLDLAIRALTDRHITITTTHIDEYISSGSSYGGGNRGGERFGGSQEETAPVTVAPVISVPAVPYHNRADDDYAAGGSFQVPPGYLNDSYPLGPGKWASSGEIVTISSTFQITQQPGQDGAALADMVMQRLSELTRRARTSGARYMGG